MGGALVTTNGWSGEMGFFKIRSVVYSIAGLAGELESECVSTLVTEARKSWLSNMRPAVIPHVSPGVSG